MEPKHISSVKSKIRIIIIAVISFVFIVLATAFFLIHSYISKMNLAGSDKSKRTELQVTSGQALSEEKDTDEPDSTEDEVDSVENEIKYNMEKNRKPIIYDKHVFNILLIGSDTRTEGGPGRSDAMILVSINKKTKKK